MRLNSPVSTRESILNTIIRRFSKQVNPVEVIRELNGDSAAQYAAIIGNCLLDNPIALIEIAVSVNGDIPIQRREPSKVRGKPNKRELLEWRDYILYSLNKKLRFGHDSHIRGLITTLKWGEHGEAVERLVPQVKEYRDMRLRYHAPYRDPDPYIIGCHGCRCSGTGGISRQIVSTVVNRRDIDN